MKQTLGNQDGRKHELQGTEDKQVITWFALEKWLEIIEQHSLLAYKVLGFNPSI